MLFLALYCTYCAPMPFLYVYFALVRVPNPLLGSGLGERTPSERVILLQRLLALKMWLVPPHMAHIFGFCGTWRGPGRCQNFGKSFQIVTRANLAAPPVCPLLRRQFVHFCLSISATVFLNILFWICFPLVMDPDFSDILSILVASVIDCEKEVIGLV